MGKVIKALVKPEILIWARENAGFSQIEAAKKAGVNVDKYLSWEQGSDSPTVKQLKKLSDSFKISLAIFYLQEVPPDFKLVHDFRRISDINFSGYSSKLRYEIRQTRQRRKQALELLKEMGKEILPFNYKCNLNDNPEDVGQYIRNIIGFTVEEQKSYKNTNEAFKQIRSKIEKIGVLVFLTQPAPHGIEVDEMRGFALFETTLPVIAINNNDTKNGKIFSIIHEFTHLLLGQSGVSDMNDYGSWQNEQDKKIEVFCNSVAASTLTPEADLKNILKDYEDFNIDEKVENLSKYFNVSKEVILRRFLTFNYINQKTYQQKKQQYINEYLDNKKNQKEKNKGIKIPRNMPREITNIWGDTYINLVIDNYFNNNITLNESSDFLGGIKIKYFKKIAGGVI